MSQKPHAAFSTTPPLTDAPHPRLFVALDLPRPISDRLRILARPTRLPALRWAPQQSWHITLHFIGAAPLQKVHAALSTVHAPAFEANLHSLGTFGAPKVPRVLWAGVPRSDALLALHRAVGRALSDVGFTLDTRPYEPHVTLSKIGRLRPRDAQSVEAFVSENDAFETPAFRVESFTLFESVSDGDGPVYVSRGQYQLVEGEELSAVQGG